MFSPELQECSIDKQKGMGQFYKQKFLPELDGAVEMFRNRNIQVFINWNIIEPKSIKIPSEDNLQNLQNKML